MSRHTPRTPRAWARTAVATSSANAELDSVFRQSRAVSACGFRASAALALDKPIEQLHDVQDLLPGLVHLHARAHLQQASWIGGNDQLGTRGRSVFHLLRQQL